MAALLAEQLKQKGNEYFRSGDYEEAVNCYSQAIQKNSQNPLLWTNRANARLKLQQWDEVIDDCLKGIDLMRDNMKAYFYLGVYTGDIFKLWREGRCGGEGLLC